MKNIVFFNSAIAWGGGEKWHLEASLYMHQNGYNVLVVAHEKSVLLKKLKQLNIPSVGITVGNLSFLNPFKVNKVKKIIKKHNTETIIINLSNDLKLAGLAGKKANVNRIIYRRGSAIPIKNSFLNRFYFREVVTDILANSNATKQTVLQNNKTLFPKEKITVIYNGIDIDAFLQKVSTKLYYTKTKDELVLTNLGRLEYQKNQVFLIHVAKELQNRNINFKLLIGGEGSLRGDLETLIQKLKVEKKVELLGFIDDPKAFMKSGDVFLLPSHWEGFGYVLAEASLCKKPIVAFNVSSNPEVVQHNNTGFLTPPENIEAFVDAIIKLNENPNLQTNMGEQGLHFIQQNFNKKNILNQVKTYLTNS